MDSLLLDPAISSRLVLTLAHFLWQGAAVFALTLTLLAVMRRTRAQARYLMLVGLFAVMATCPPMTFVLLEPAPAQMALHSESTVAGEGEESRAWKSGAMAASSGMATAAGPVSADPDNAGKRVARNEEQNWVSAMLSRGAPYALAAYLLGTAVMLARLLLAVYGGRRLVQLSKPVGEAVVLESFSRQTRLLGLRLTPGVAYSRHVAVPTVVGVLRPMVLLPISISTGLSAEQIEMLLAHELAHIRRFDHLVNVFQRVVESALFFHPAVWWVSNRIRAEREHCCDDVVITAGGQRLVYAESLIRMAEFSRDYRNASLAAAMALGADGRHSELGNRILRLVTPGWSEPVRLVRGGLIVTVAIIVTLFTGVAQLAGLEAADTHADTPDLTSTRPATAEDEQVAEEEDQASITGRVTEFESNKPIAGALVRLASPAVDMRHIRKDPRQHKIFEGRTDEDGRFELTIPQSAAKSFTLDAFAKGYGSAAGTHQGGGLNVSDAWLNAAKHRSRRGYQLMLLPGIHVAGVLRDEEGKPFAGATVEATERRTSSYGYVTFTRTDKDGRFEIFDFHPPEHFKDSETRGQLAFSHPDMLRSIVANVYALSAEDRERIDVTIRRGEMVRGRVLDSKGQPVSDAVIIAPPPESADRKEVRTDQDGRFTIKGLPKGAVALRCHIMDRKEKAEMQFDTGNAASEVTLNLSPVHLANPPEPIEMLGMKVADLTPELQKLYGLYTSKGVLVLESDRASLRFGVGEGNCFWMVGNRKIANVREFVGEALRIQAKPEPRGPGSTGEGYEGKIRVVFEYGTGKGTNTQYLRLTDEDVESLKQLAGKLGVTAEPDADEEEERAEERSAGPRAAQRASRPAPVDESAIKRDINTDAAASRPSTRAAVDAGSETGESEMILPAERTCSLKIHYEMPGGPPKADFQINRMGDEPQERRKIAVDNGSEATIPDLPSGEYGVYRTKYLGINEHGRYAVLDQQIVLLLADRTTTVEFVRSAARRKIMGELAGLPERGIGTFISIYPGKAAELPIHEAVQLPRFDMLTAPAGKFETDRLPPGEYCIKATAYGPPPERVREGFIRSGVQAPAYVGMAKLVIPEQGEPSPVRIEMRRWTSSDTYWYW